MMRAAAPSATLPSRVSLRGAPLRAAAVPQAQPRRRSVRVAAGLVEKLNAEQLEVAIAERDRPLVIDFFARHGSCAWMMSFCGKVYSSVMCAAAVWR
jgi:hypothetical protein